MACALCRAEDLCNPDVYERMQAELPGSSGAKKRRHQDDNVTTPCLPVKDIWLALN